MKILYHHRTISKDGQDVHIQEMVAALRRRGHHVVVLAPPTMQKAAFGSDGGTLGRIRRVLPRALSELLELAYSLPAYRRLHRAWIAERPDFLYERYNLFFLSGAWLKRKLGIPLLLEINAPLYDERRIHGGLTMRRLAAWSERTAWRAVDRALPVTQNLAEYVARAGVPSDRIRVIPNGVNRDHFPPTLDGSTIRAELGLGDSLVLGFTGFLRPWHGLTHVLDVMAKLCPLYNLHFLIIGEGPGSREIEEKARTWHLSDRVTMLGLVDRERIGRYIAAFDIAVQPRVVPYASPLKLFEYMALGRAIIAPDQPNIREILEHDVNAILFPEDNHRAFHEGLSRLCQDPSLRQRLGAAARRTIEDEEYTWDANARRVEEMALELIGKNINRL